MKYLFAMLLALMIFGCNDGIDSNDAKDSGENDSSDLMDTDMPYDSDSMMAGDYTDLSPMEVKTMIDSEENVVVIDVSPAYDEDHIPGAINFYIGDGSLTGALELLDKSFTYIVYCHTDAASIPGARAFVDAGFKKVYRLEGNFGAWTDGDNETEATTDGYMDVNPATAYSLILAEPMIFTVDVSPYYDDGHLPGAMSYPLGSALTDGIPSFDDMKKYLVYCHGDGPSISGSEEIFEAGLMPVYRLQGNYGAWIAAEFPTE